MVLKKSCKGSECIAYCEQLIDEIDPHQDLSRPGKFNRAIAKAKTNSIEDWALRAKGLKRFKNNIPEGVSVPTALQMKVEDTLVSDLLVVEETIKEALNLSTLQTRYEVEILEFNYLEVLKKEVLEVGESKNGGSTDLNGPEMVKILVQILLLNRDSDKAVIEKVKEALLEWRE